MFLGEYKHNLTTGKRLALPKKIREQITGDEVVLAKGFEPCIFGFDRKTWDEAAKQELLVPISEGRGREIRRQMFAAAEVVDIDVQGRVVLPDTLVSWAGIKGEMTVIGAGDHFEVWDSDTWKTYLEKIETKQE
ncbi:MAG: division/cell wall cluster transcriptional repressor MraZ [Patescibacteria group bacterium]